MNAPHQPVEFEPRRRQLSVDDLVHMFERGILADEERVELIDGELLTMTVPGWPHTLKLGLLTRAFVGAAGDQGFVSIQSGIHLSKFNLPMPDLALFRASVLKGRQLPTALDAILLIEVSDSSLAFDLRRKARVYATHGVPEYWILDVNGQRMLRFLEPTPEGYRRQDELRGRVAPQGLPGCEVDVEEFLEPPPDG